MFETSKQDLWLMITFSDVANIRSMSLGSTDTMLFEEKLTPKSYWIWCSFFFRSLQGNGGYLNANNHGQLVFYYTKVLAGFPTVLKYSLFIYAQAVYLIMPMEATFLLVHINDKDHRHTLKISRDEFSYHSSFTSQRCNKNPDGQLAVNKIRDSHLWFYIFWCMPQDHDTGG